MEIAMEMKEGGSAIDQEEKWVADSSVDYKGRTPLRASTGVWKASLFIIAIEFSERLSFFGIATNLIIYLTQVLHQDLKTAARNVNYWAGVTAVMPLLGGFLADAYLGRFKAVLFSCTIYLTGLTLMTLSRYIPSLKPCHTTTCDKPTDTHQVIFFLALYLISIGTGGHKPSLESFGADQFDDDHPEERRQKMSFFNWWNSGLCLGLLLGVTVVVYVEDFVSWGLADIILTSIMAASLAVFVVGVPVYRYRTPQGSPFTPMAQVLVAAVAKRKLAYPPSPSLLYEVGRPQGGESRRLHHTTKLRFLDKAAIIERPEDLENPEAPVKKNPWRLSPVTRVEETKLVLNMIPIWLATLVFGISNAQGTTFFVKQGSIMDRNLGRGFKIPSASMYAFTAVAMIVAVTIYDKLLVPTLRRLTGNDRGINILPRIGVGMGFSIVVMVTAAAVEKKRLEGVYTNVFWLAPQFALLGVADTFGLVGLQEYFYDQVPDSMRSLGIAFYLSVGGVSNFLSSLLVTAVDRATSDGGRSSGWIGRDLNGSRLDKFYWLLAVIGAINLCAYALLARTYSYKKVERTITASS